MMNLQIVRNLNECRALWEQEMPRDNVTDLWEFRDCFQRHYKRSLVFLKVTDRSRVTGLLPLSYIEETRSYGYFPGEIWDGKTWIEQNRIIARTTNAREAFHDWLTHNREAYHLRYLLPSATGPAGGEAVDEIGYLFMPREYNYDFDNYMAAFSTKSAKNIRAECGRIEARGISYRFDRMEDFDLMIRMNLERYRTYSYFGDSRFLNSFRDIMIYFASQGWLRMTTILVAGKAAAVDLGCLYNGTYTLMAGGTSAEFPGIAKVINLFHIRRACQERFKKVDFLCGDFSWKARFHLKPRPLYVSTNIAVEVPVPLGDRPEFMQKPLITDRAARQ